MIFPTVGERLRILRKNKKVSLQFVADDIGIFKSSLGNIERGNKAVSLELLFSFAEYYHVSIDYLLGRTEKPEINT